MLEVAPPERSSGARASQRGRSIPSVLVIAILAGSGVGAQSEPVTALASAEVYELLGEAAPLATTVDGG